MIMKKMIYFILIVISFFSCEKVDKSVDLPQNTIDKFDSIYFNQDLQYVDFKDDRDGKVYKTIKIGNQVWFAQNLDYNMEGSIYLWNDSTYAKSGYGRLYKKEFIFSSVPHGWHVPSAEEWDELIIYLGGFDNAGLKLKENSNAHWFKTGKGTNESGFTAVPSAAARTTNDFFQVNDAYYWSSTIDGASLLYYRIVGPENRVIKTLWDDGIYYSIRCIKD